MGVSSLLWVREAARVIGILTEKHTLKRYSDELDRQRRASVGDALRWRSSSSL
jgi:hypothetical protein